MYQQPQSTTGNPYTQRGHCGSHSAHGGKWMRGAWRAPWMKRFEGAFGPGIAANIEEDADAFHIHLYAAGLSKEAIRISVEEDVLRIAYQAPEMPAAEEQRYAHREYRPASFERRFSLNGKVLTEGISAAYADGILKVTLPKNPETNKPAQQVNVA